jgi:hypothetical protein
MSAGRKNMTRGKRLSRAFLALAIAGVAIFTGAGVAEATDRPNAFSCGWDRSLVGPHEYFAFVNIVDGQSVPDCFADAGNMTFDPPEVAYQWASGNNAGYFAFMCPGDFWYQLLYFDKNQGGWLCNGGAASAKVGSLLIY